MFMTQFTKVILFTDTDGYAKFREEEVPLPEGNPQSMLSAVFASGGYQLRNSPVGFRSQFHCSGHVQWCFILSGQMEIGVHGESRVFGPGQHFYSADLLPEGATFNPAVHGHWSRQMGDEPLVTLFVRG
jgi:mannose-6-phosphate isomerase-like protein (cupin superfamily)